jgi:hypothetical protein
MGDMLLSTTARSASTAAIIFSRSSTEPSAGGVSTTLASLGEVTIPAATQGALLTSLASVIVHPLLAWRFSSDPVFSRRVAAGTAFAVLAGVVGFLIGVSLGGVAV